MADKIKSITNIKIIQGDVGALPFEEAMLYFRARKR
jgi:hypothetical protein